MSVVVSSCDRMVKQLRPNLITRFCCKGLYERLKSQIKPIARFRIVAEKLRLKSINESSTIVVIDLVTSQFSQSRQLFIGGTSVFWKRFEKIFRR